MWKEYTLLSLNRSVSWSMIEWILRITALASHNRFPAESVLFLLLTGIQQVAVSHLLASSFPLHSRFVTDDLLLLWRLSKALKSRAVFASPIQHSTNNWCLAQAFHNDQWRLRNLVEQDFLPVLLFHYGRDNSFMVWHHLDELIFPEDYKHVVLKKELSVTYFMFAELSSMIEILNRREEGERENCDGSLNAWFIFTFGAAAVALRTFSVIVELLQAK